MVVAFFKATARYVSFHLESAKAIISIPQNKDVKLILMDVPNKDVFIQLMGRFKRINNFINQVDGHKSSAVVQLTYLSNEKLFTQYRLHEVVRNTTQELSFMQKNSVKVTDDMQSQNLCLYDGNNFTYNDLREFAGRLIKKAAGEKPYIVCASQNRNSVF